MSAMCADSTPSASYSFVHGTTIDSVIAPSRWTPSVSLWRQQLGRPLRQLEHIPQFVYGETVTAWPILQASGTFAPFSTIVAEISCPGVRGNLTSGLSPLYVLRSLPQNPT